MAGRGPAPKAERRNRSDVPIRGEWRAEPGIGWQHGDLPAAPTGLLKVSRETWATWFGAWFAAHWTPDDLPMLRQVAKLYDKVERGTALSAERTELRQLADSYGITPKGQQDRRWKPPAEDGQPATVPASAPTGRYGHLRIAQ